MFRCLSSAISNMVSPAPEVLPPSLDINIKTLEKQKEWQDKQRRILSNEYIENNLINTMENGRFIYPDYLSKRFFIFSIDIV